MLIFVISENRCTHETCITFITSFPSHRFYRLRKVLSKRLWTTILCILNIFFFLDMEYINNFIYSLLYISNPLFLSVDLNYWCSVEQRILIFLEYPCWFPVKVEEFLCATYFYLLLFHLNTGGILYKMNGRCVDIAALEQMNDPRVCLSHLLLLHERFCTIHEIFNSLSFAQEILFRTFQILAWVEIVIVKIENYFKCVRVSLFYFSRFHFERGVSFVPDDCDEIFSNGRNMRRFFNGLSSILWFVKGFLCYV